ncbi:hypothetical protein B0H13DRAFT_1912436 [Mycena leptocephala]|nr:hypothetical protein B0H13DRAFT_1912436 [Mycena leptocephala]
MDFFHTYWNFLPTAKALTQIMLCIVHAPIILALDKDAQTSKVIRATPGVRFVLAMAWRGMLGEDELFTRPGALLAISEAVGIATEDADQGSNFDELVEAAGGTVKDLASLVIQHFSRAQSTPKSKETVIFLLSCFQLLYGSSDAAHSLGVALRSMGTPPDIALAIESGLLQVVVTIAGSIKDDADSKHAIIQRLFDKVLLPSLVHYAVVAQLQKCFPEAAAVSARFTNGTSPFATAWGNLWALIESRVDFFNSWEAQSRPSLKACHNLTCGKIAPRHNFKCCAACRTADYCSEECQSADWRGGQKTMTVICIRKVFFMYEHPGEQTLVIFDYYSPGRFGIHVAPSSHLESCDSASEMLVQIPRAARSDGRMDLHLMITETDSTPGQCLVSTGSPSFLRGIGRERRGVEVERDERESDGGRAHKGMKRRGKGEESEKGVCAGTAQLTQRAGKWNADLQALASPSGGEKNKDENDSEGNEGEKKGRTQTHNKREDKRTLRLNSKQPEQHDELEPKRDLPHAYGLGAREFRVQVCANGIQSARVTGWKNKEEDARKREFKERKEDSCRDRNLKQPRYSSTHLLGPMSARPFGGGGECGAEGEDEREQHEGAEESAGLEDGDDVGGDGLCLGRYGLAIRVEQAIVRAEEGLRDYAACDPAFVSLVRVGRVRKAKGRQRTYRKSCLVFFRFRVRTGETPLPGFISLRPISHYPGTAPKFDQMCPRRSTRSGAALCRWDGKLDFSWIWTETQEGGVPFY